MNNSFLTELTSKHMPLDGNFSMNHMVDMDVSHIHIPTIDDIELIKDTFKYSELYTDSVAGKVLTTMLDEVYNDFIQLKTKYETSNSTIKATYLNKLVTDYALYTIWRMISYNLISYDYRSNLEKKLKTVLVSEEDMLKSIINILNLGYRIITKDKKSNEAYTYEAIKNSYKEMLLNMDTNILDKSDDVLKSEASVFGIESGKVYTNNRKIFQLKYRLYLLASIDETYNTVRLITFIKCNQWYHNDAYYKIDTKLSFPFKIVK